MPSLAVARVRRRSWRSRRRGARSAAIACLPQRTSAASTRLISRAAGSSVAELSARKASTCTRASSAPLASMPKRATNSSAIAPPGPAPAIEIDHGEVGGDTHLARQAAAAAEAFTGIAVAGIGDGGLVVAALLQHQHHRILDLLDAQARLVAGPGELLLDHPCQLPRQVGIIDAHRMLGAGNGRGDAAPLERHLMAVAFDHRGRGHRWSWSRTRDSSCMNSSRSLNWRYTEAKRT